MEFGFCLTCSEKAGEVEMQTRSIVSAKAEVRAAMPQRLRSTSISCFHQLVPPRVASLSSGNSLSALVSDHDSAASLPSTPLSDLAVLSRLPSSAFWTEPLDSTAVFAKLHDIISNMASSSRKQSAPAELEMSPWVSTSRQVGLETRKHGGCISRIGGESQSPRET